ncbi:anti-sigma factor domain-containing protein [Paenibacillus sp. D51F]
MTSQPYQPHGKNMECDNVELYSAGALDAAERVAFEEHLEQCAECSAELQELQKLMNLLPLAVDPIEPPEGMKKRVLGAVLGRNNAQDPSLGRQADAGLAKVDYPEEDASDRRRTEAASASKRNEDAGSAAWTSNDESRRRTAAAGGRRQRLVALLAGAAAVMLLVCGTLAQRMDSLGKKNEQLASELEAAKQNLVQAQSELQNVMKPSADAAVSQIISLKPVKNMVAKGQAYIVVDAKGTHLIVQASKLPALKDSQAFQVWLIKGDKPVNAGTFKPVNGSGAITFTFQPDSFDQVAITLEPDAFGTAPRGTMVMAGGLKA